MNQNCRILRIASSNSRDRERSRRGAASPFHVASTSTMVRHASHRMVNAHTKNHVASDMDNGQNLSLMQRTSQILGPPVGYASFSIESVDIGAILTLYRVSVLHVWHILVVFHKRLHSKTLTNGFVGYSCVYLALKEKVYIKGYQNICGWCPSSSLSTPYIFDSIAHGPDAPHLCDGDAKNQCSKHHSAKPAII